MTTLAKVEDWRPGWVFDGRKNLYAPSMFLPQHESTFVVRCASATLHLALLVLQASGSDAAACSTSCTVNSCGAAPG